MRHVGGVTWLERERGIVAVAAVRVHRATTLRRARRRQRRTCRWHRQAAADLRVAVALSEGNVPCRLVEGPARLTRVQVCRHRKVSRRWACWRPRFDQPPWMPRPLLVHRDCLDVGDQWPRSIHPSGIAQIERQIQRRADDRPAAKVRAVMLERRQVADLEHVAVRTRRTTGGREVSSVLTSHVSDRASE